MDASGPLCAVDQFRLANGLRVALHVDASLPLVHVNSWFHVGSKDAPNGRTGLAHLCEHLWFEGSTHADTNFEAFVRQAGANQMADGVNGSTDEDRTVCYTTVPSGNLPFLLWLEADRLGTLPDALTQKKLDAQRSIIRNEPRQLVDHRPYGRAWPLIARTLYPKEHPYRRHNPVGRPEDLDATTLEDVRAFFRRYYVPNNLSLAITGDFDPTAAKDLIHEYYEGIPSGPSFDRQTRWVPMLDRERIVDAWDHVPRDRLYLAWPSPAYFDADDAALELASLTLTDTASSRLHRALVRDQPLCSNVRSAQESREIAGQFVIEATFMPGVSAASVAEEIASALRRLAFDGPTDDEVRRTKIAWRLRFLSGLERIGSNGGQADVLNRYSTYLGSALHAPRDLARHAAITAADVRDAVRRWLVDGRGVQVRYRAMPTAPNTATIRVGSPTPPALDGDRPFHVPNVKSAHLPNGLEIYVIERRQMPRVSVTFAARAGSASTTMGKAGLAEVMLDLITNRAAGTRPIADIDGALADIGATFRSRVAPECALLRLDVLTEHLECALRIIAAVVQHPTVRPDELAWAQARQRNVLEQHRADPATVALRLANVLTFGADHPYGRLPTDESLAAIGPDDIADFHRACWTPDRSVLVFVGDVSLEDASAFAAVAFSGWSAKGLPVPPVPTPTPAGPGQIFLLDRPGAALSVVSSLSSVPGRESSAFYPLVIANAILGGSSSARLGANLRERKGYSSGFSSFVSRYSGAGLWLAIGSVRTDTTADTASEMRNELRAIAGAGPATRQEFDDARRDEVRGFAQHFESWDRMAQQVLLLWAAGLPISELQHEPEAMRATTMEAVNEAAATYARPEAAMILVVGDRLKIRDDIRSLASVNRLELTTKGVAIDPDP